MRDIATATLSGNLTRDVELRELPSGAEVARLRVASTARRRNGEEWVDKTNYFTVEVYGAQARACAEYLAKGSRVLVDAEPDWREWTDQQQHKREAVTFRARQILFEGTRRESTSEGEGAQGDGAAGILTDALRQIGGRCATALFGNAASLLADGTRPMPLVPGIRTGGGTAFAGDAIELVSDRLEMTNPRRPRFVYVLSDGGWADTRAGVERIRWLGEHRVPTIHLSIGIAPLSVECDRITVITEPAQALDHIAADTVAALRARRR